MLDCAIWRPQWGSAGSTWHSCCPDVKNSNGQGRTDLVSFGGLDQIILQGLIPVLKEGKGSRLWL